LGKVGVQEINSTMATFIRTVIILLFTAGLVIVRQEWEPLDKLSRHGVVMLILSGLATGMSWLCYYRALQLGPASRVAPLDKLSVVLVIIFSVAFLGESLSWKLAVGGSMIALGAMILAV
jgi:transporter family protein